MVDGGGIKQSPGQIWAFGSNNAHTGPYQYELNLENLNDVVKVCTRISQRISPREKK